jgi:hypothetical protein
MLNTTVYKPELSNFIFPVLVPTPLNGLTPNPGTTFHVTPVLGLPPLITKLALSPRNIAALLGVTLTVLKLGFAHGNKGGVTKKSTVAVEKLASVQPTGLLLFFVVKITL